MTRQFCKGRNDVLPHQRPMEQRVCYPDYLTGFLSENQSLSDYQIHWHRKISWRSNQERQQEFYFHFLNVFCFWPAEKYNNRNSDAGGGCLWREVWMLMPAPPFYKHRHKFLPKLSWKTGRKVWVLPILFLFIFIYIFSSMVLASWS